MTDKLTRGIASRLLRLMREDYPGHVMSAPYIWDIGGDDDPAEVGIDGHVDLVWVVEKVLMLASAESTT